MALKIGFTNKYFTLWNVTESKQYHTDSQGKNHLSHIHTNYNYKQNLSFDKDKAIIKAEAKGCTDLEPDTDLYGTTRSFRKTKYIELPPEVFENHVFHYGKHFRKDIRECYDGGYVRWFFQQENYTGDEQKQILMERICELFDYYVIYKGELITEQALENIKVGKAREKFIAENGYLEVEKLQKNFDEDGRLYIGVDLFVEKVKEYYYQDWAYYLPVFNGKGMRIKNKKVRFYIDRKADVNGIPTWIVDNIEIIKK